MKVMEMVMVKWLLVVVAMVLGASLARAETVSLGELERQFGNYEASCENMTLVKLESKDLDFTGKVKVLPFDGEKCSRVLKPIQMNDVFKPLFLMNLNSDPTPFSKSPIVRKIQRLVQDLRQKNMVKLLHAKAQPLADACSAAAAGAEKNAAVMCYFGGPTADSGKPFKAIYQAMLDHALPDSETVCSSEPITSKTASTKTFGAFLTSNVQPLTWDELQVSLKSDGFHCDEDQCQRNILGVISPRSKLLDDKSGVNGKPPFGIIPRYLAVYRGDWRVIGPPSRCIAAGGGPCNIAGNGIQAGICLASEDWHVWFRVAALMNEIKNE